MIDLFHDDQNKEMHCSANVSMDGITATLVTCSTNFVADPWSDFDQAPFC